MPGQRECQVNVTICATQSINRLAAHSILLGPLQYSRLNGKLLPTPAETMEIQEICGALDKSAILAFHTAVWLV